MMNDRNYLYSDGFIEGSGTHYRPDYPRNEYMEGRQMKKTSAITITSIICATAIAITGIFAFMMNSRKDRNTVQYVTQPAPAGYAQTETGASADGQDKGIAASDSTDIGATPAEKETVEAANETEKTETPVPAPGTEKTETHLWDLDVMQGSFGTVFNMNGAEKDYSGTMHDPLKNAAYVVYADGTEVSGTYYMRPVTFANPDGYRYVTGHMYLPNDQRTLEDVKTGFIRLVLLDESGATIEREYVQLDAKTREADFWIDISGMDVFTMAVDCTDGSGGGDHMMMIVDGLTLTK